MSAIRIEKVSKAFGPFDALREVSFEVAAGTLTVLLGPSGCGKSTLLRTIAGLESASEGRILIDGVDVTDRPPSRRKISMVFQSYALFPHLNVAENIVFGLRVRKVSRAERDRRLASVAALLGLTGLLDRKPSQLSGGQQQRVAMGRAIISEAPICLMDEPMSNLDAKLRADMRVELHALQRKLGMTVIYVTHDQVEAMSMADQVVLLNAGRVEQIASPEAMYAAPQSLFAARFIGLPPMNLLDLEMDPQGRATLPGGPPIQAPRSGSELILGLRPEDIVLSDTGLPAEVRDAEYLGADTVLRCQVGRQILLVRVDRRVPVRASERVHLDWRPEAARLFDKATGQAVN